MSDFSKIVDIYQKFANKSAENFVLFAPAIEEFASNTVHPITFEQKSSESHKLVEDRLAYGVQMGHLSNSYEHFDDFDTLKQTAENCTSGLLGKFRSAENLKESPMAINSVYFHSIWRPNFQTAKPGKFTLPDGKDVQVPMTETKGYETSNHIEFADLDAEGWKVPFCGESECSAWFIIPKAAQNFAKLRDGFNGQHLKTLFNEEEAKHCLCQKFIIPLFTLRSEATFKLGEVFPDAPVHLRACVEVTDKGLPTHLAICSEFATPPPVVKIDRSFLFAVVHNYSERVVFFGHVTNPQTSG